MFIKFGDKTSPIEVKEAKLAVDDEELDGADESDDRRIKAIRKHILRLEEDDASDPDE